MHFSDTSKASSMCDDISPAVPNPIHCKGDIHCVSVPLEPEAHRPNMWPSLREKKKMEAGRRNHWAHSLLMRAVADKW